MPDSPETLTYNAQVQTLFAQREHAGQLAPAANVASGEAGSQSQSVHVRFWLEHEAGRVTRARVEAYACPHLLAAASHLAAWTEGKPLDELLAWEWRPLAESLQAPIEKWGRFLILEDAMKEAVKKALGEEGTRR